MLVVVMGGATSTSLLVHGVAGAGARAPRVEDVAVRAVAQLGDAAPFAIVAALADGASLGDVVEQIETDTLAVATPPTTIATPPDTGGDAGDAVVVVGDRGFEPRKLVVDPSAPLIVANRGSKVHVVEIKGTALPKYSLEPDLVGVYELEELEPGTYTLRCVVAGHEERATLTIRAPPTSSARRPVGGMSVNFGSPSPGLSVEDYVERLVMFDAVVEEMAQGGAEALDEAERIRTRASKAQTKLETSAGEAVTADPQHLVERAERDGVDPALALLTNAILLAANNGYDAGQITEFLLDDELAPQVWETGQGSVRLRDVFLAGGVIIGVRPDNPPVDDALRADARPEPKTSDRDTDEPGAEGQIDGRYEGEFVGRLFEQYLAASHPGGLDPIRNRVDVTIDDDGQMRFTLALIVHAAWVSEDDTVTCDSRVDLFSEPARPTARLQGDGTFESSTFRAVVRQSDFSGPTCSTHPYTGENDEDLAGLVLEGTVDGDTARGKIPFEAEGESFELQFRATRR